MLATRIFLGRARRNVERRVSRLWIDAFAHRTRETLDRLGSDENGWYAPAAMPSHALWYCIGVGLDASFDFELAGRGFDVHSFDPTPPAIDYMNCQPHGRVNLHPWGVLDADTTDRLHVPLNPTHGSYFLENLHHSKRDFEVPFYRLETILGKLNHKTPYLLKMDIEGNWFRVIPDIIAAGILPEFLMLEYDSPASVNRVSRAHRVLENSGYAMVLREADNVVYRRVNT
jgi:FkbM family methyltransferase